MVVVLHSTSLVGNEERIRARVAEDGGQLEQADVVVGEAELYGQGTEQVLVQRALHRAPQAGKRECHRQLKSQTFRCHGTEYFWNYSKPWLLVRSVQVPLISIIQLFFFSNRQGIFKTSLAAF